MIPQWLLCYEIRDVSICLAACCLAIHEPHHNVGRRVVGHSIINDPMGVIGLSISCKSRNTIFEQFGRTTIVMVITCDLVIGLICSETPINRLMKLYL